MKKVGIFIGALFVGCSIFYLITSTGSIATASTPKVEKISLKKDEQKTIDSNYNDEILKVNMKLNDITIVDEIKAPEPINYDSVSFSEDNTKYLKIDLTIKNLGPIELNSLELDGESSTECNPNINLGKDNEYATLTALQIDNTNNSNDLTTIVSIIPGAEKQIYLFTRINKNANLNNPKIAICLGHKPIYLNIK